MNNIKHIPYIKVSGTNEDMGYTHGQVFANLISSIYTDRLDILLSLNRNISISDIRETANLLWEHVCDFDLHVASEIAAAANGSGLQPWQMIVAGGYTDLMDLLVRDFQQDCHECTIAINPEYGYLAGTWDSHLSASSALVLLERHPKDSPSTLALTTAGWPCQQGVNSSGLAFAITNLTPRQADTNGLIYIAANAALGSSYSIEDIVTRFENTKFCSGHSYIVLDANGKAVIIETTAKDVRIEHIHRLSTKANHYKDGEGSIDDNCNYFYLECSVKRELELLNNISNVSNAAGFQSCLEKSLYVNRMDISQPTITCASYFINPKTKTLWFSKGPLYKSSLMSYRQLMTN